MACRAYIDIWLSFYRWTPIDIDTKSWPSPLDKVMVRWRSPWRAKRSQPLGLAKWSVCILDRLHKHFSISHRECCSGSIVSPGMSNISNISHGQYKDASTPFWGVYYMGYPESIPKFYFRTATPLCLLGSKNIRHCSRTTATHKLSKLRAELLTIYALPRYTMLKGTNASATVTVSSDLAYVLELRHSHLESSNLERDRIIKMIKMVPPVEGDRNSDHWPMARWLKLETSQFQKFYFFTPEIDRKMKPV